MLVNWDGERKYPCPCGKGEYAHRWHESDWGGIKGEDYIMLCPDCEPLYAYDRRNIGSFVYGEITRRGWVRKDVLREEERYHQALRDFQKAVVQKVDELCRETWRSKLAACKSKKAVWELNEKRQAYYTFTSHVRGQTLQQVIQDQMNRPFHYSEAKHILGVCGKDVDPDSLVDVPKPIPPASLPKAFQGVWERGGDFRERSPLSEQEIPPA